MYRFKQFIMLLGDLAALYGGLYAAVILRETWRVPEVAAQSFLALLAPMNFLFAVAALIMFIAGLYDIGRAQNTLGFYKKIIISALLWIVIGIMYFYLKPDLRVAPKTILALTAVLGFGFLAAWRFVHNRFLSANILKSRIVFIGESSETNELVAVLCSEPQRGYEIVGIVSEGATARSGNSLLPRAATWDEFMEKAGQTGTVHLAVMAPQYFQNEQLVKNLYATLFKQTEIVELAAFYEKILGRVPQFTFSDAWFLTHLHEGRGRMYDRLRSLADYSLGMVLGVIVIITFPIVAPIIKLTSRGPVFFSQKRVGRLGKTFTMYKYRTMHALRSDGSAELTGPQFASLGDRRVTGIGRVLRRTRLDELPQFWNILRSEMSFIGPRPERPEFVQQLIAKIPYYALRHLVKPGLTGWAQIHKGYYGTIDENLFKLQYDLYYIKNRTPMLDAVILLRTINIVARMMGR